jgi:hypothetical protein
MTVNNMLFIFEHFYRQVFLKPFIGNTFKLGISVGE